MPVIIDYSQMYRDADEVSKRFNTAYSLVKKSIREKYELNKTEIGIVKVFCKDAFNIHPEIRKAIPCLNDRLSEMASKGFLELKEKYISPFDPATRDLYWRNLSDRIRAL